MRNRTCRKGSGRPDSKFGQNRFDVISLNALKTDRCLLPVMSTLFAFSNRTITANFALIVIAGILNVAEC